MITSALEREKKRKNVRRTGTAAGRRLIASLAEAVEAGDRGDRPYAVVRTLTLPDDPSVYDAAKVRATHENLGVSQLVFARLVGAPAKWVQLWEGGTRGPSLMARRLFDEINREPERWKALAMASGT